MLSLLRFSQKVQTGFSWGVLGVIPTANLTGRTTRGEPLKLRPGFPYRKKNLSVFHTMLDPTVRRIEEENARLIIIDGPIAAGKSALAKLLAEEFDMICMDQPTMDDIYITRTGFDLRSFDDQLPESVRTFDHKNFCVDPRHPNVAAFQLEMFYLRCKYHIDALAHILNTGQGVVMERSPYSEITIVDAMYSEGFISKDVYEAYNISRDIALPLLMHPHVVIYLDTPAQIVQDRIKARNLCYEKDSPAYTTTFLEAMEKSAKDKYLKEAIQDSEVLIYDWSEGGDVDIVIEDLEKLNLDPLKRDEFGQLSDWKTWRRDWRGRRLIYTNQKEDLIDTVRVIFYEVPELVAETKDLDLREKLYDSAPGMIYESGFDPTAGDGVFKTFIGSYLPRPRKPTALRG